VLDAELTMIGPQGPVRGGSGQRDGAAIRVLEVRHPLVSPRDEATGQATGKRRHAPIAITKDIDRSSPVLASA